MRYFDDQELENVFSNQTCESCHFFDDGPKECWLQEVNAEEPQPIGEERIEKLIDDHEFFGKK
jgi:hypothetical protein